MDRQFWVAGGLGVVTLGLLLFTLGDPGMVWDEGITIRRQERVRAWFGELFRPHQLKSRWMAFRSHVIINREADRTSTPYRPLVSYWPYTRVIEGHPPFYGMVGVIGWVISHWWLPPLEAHRFGPALLFSITAAGLYLALARQYGSVAGLVGAASLVFMPRMFSHAHFASYDVPVMCFWVLAWVSFWPALGGTGVNAWRTWRWRVAFGVLLGLAMATKFTGWLAPLPFVLWCVVYRDWRAVRTVAWGLALAVLTFYCVNPPLWHDPLSGFQDFFYLNLYRAQSEGLNISAVFLDKSYDLEHSLPWFNTLVWTVIGIPVGLLVLSMLGLVQVVGNVRDRFGMMILFHWALLMVVRALPGSPPHDGIRLFLPSFAFLAALAGIGAAVLIGYKTYPKPDARNPMLGIWGSGLGLGVWGFGIRISAAIALLCVGGSAFSTWYYHPYQLSHYSLLCGGLPGAVRLGMEPTYYWDCLTEDVLAWLNDPDNTPGGRSVLFSSEQDSWVYLNRWEKLRPPVAQLAPRQKPAWYVLQLRPSSFRKVDWHLLRHYRPAFVKRLHDPPRWRWGAYRLDVPLIQIYSYTDYVQAFHGSNPSQRSGGGRAK